MDAHADLERTIEANLDDTAARGVLADLLQSRGDPRGELIALHLGGKTDEAKAHLAAHADALLGPLAAHQQTYDGNSKPAFEWKYGFIHHANLSHNYYAEKVEGGLEPILRGLLAHPSARFLSDVTMTFNNDPNEDDLQNLIDVLAEETRPTIRKLHFGDFQYAGARREQDRGEETEISWWSAGNLGALWSKLPRLETVIIQTGSADSAMSGGTTLGTLASPTLKHFEWRTGGLEAENAASIAAMETPALEYLDVWFGQAGYGGTAREDAAGAILARTDLPNLRHLGLMNCEFLDEIVPVLAKSPLLAKLAELDLSLGCLTDAGAQAIAAHADAFKHVKRLDVSHNYLTQAGIAALKTVVAEVVEDSQRSMDDDRRYSAVGE